MGIVTLICVTNSCDLNLPARQKFVIILYFL